jgi:hypothetical protein
MAPAVPEVFVPELEDVRVIMFVSVEVRAEQIEDLRAKLKSESFVQVVVLKGEKSSVARPGPVKVSLPRSREFRGNLTNS